uniref:hypothetical protein n=1 Tax=Lactococcus sp. TaxID=44273 RepID=UPI0032426A2D
MAFLPIERSGLCVSPKFMVIPLTPANSTSSSSNILTAFTPSDVNPSVLTGKVSQTANGLDAFFLFSVTLRLLVRELYLLQHLSGLRSLNLDQLY